MLNIIIMYIKIWWNHIDMLAHFYLAHKQFCLCSGDALSTSKFCQVNSKSAMARVQLAFKGNGRRL